MKHNFSEALAKDEKELGIGGGSSDFYKIQEGNKNVVRILTPSAGFILYFQGKGMKPAIAYGYDKGDPRIQGDGDGYYKPSYKFATYVLDRNDGKIKLAEFPYSVQKGIASLQENPDYTFDEVPMPYDIRIAFDREESPANMYQITAVPNGEPISLEEELDLQEKMQGITPEEFVQKKKDKQMESDKEAGVWLDDEKKAERRKEFIEEAKEQVKKQAKEDDSGKKSSKKKIDYPKDDISADEIPF